MKIVHDSGIEAEDAKRRQCTRLGCRLGGKLGLTISMMAMVFVSVITVVILSAKASSLDMQMITSPLLWLCFLPLILIPVAPFLFLKLRYALKALLVVLAILATVGLLANLGLWVMRIIVNALI